MLSLVTGATGFLGSRLARQLVARGDTVRALVRPTSNRRRIDDLPLELAQGDVTDRASVERALEGAGRVFHVAALYELGTQNPGVMERINVDGTEIVLGAAAARAIPAVHVSSVVALGPTSTTLADESHWRGDHPRSAYEATKRRAHEKARDLAAKGARLRIALPVTIYGPDDPSLVGRMHGWVVRGALRVGAFPDVPMSLVHVDDCAVGLLAIAERGKDGEEYILCERSLTFREWFELAARFAHRRPPAFYVPDWMVRAFAEGAARAAPLAGVPRELVREGVAMSLGVGWAFSGDKARRELGWAPRPLEEGLAETIAWYEKKARGKAPAEERRSVP